MQDTPLEFPKPETPEEANAATAKSRRQRLVLWIKTHRIATIAIVGAILIAIVGAIAWGIYITSVPSIDSGPTIHATRRPTVYYSPLTGVKVADEAATKQLVTAIMIENSPDARPHSGLKQAGVVFEAIAEAGITRYVALYQESKPSLVGPVRSLRPYFLTWIKPFDASIAHVGGSAKALREVRNGHYRDIDQFFNDGSYWRASDRYAPHNVYTSFAKLDALNKSKGYKTSKFTGWDRQDGKPASKPDATSITINFSSSLYNTKYTYDKKTNTYKRFLGGERHIDREKGQISPSVVIAMTVSEKTVMEDGARESIGTTGKGTAYIFQNGTVQKATWRKTSAGAQLQWLDKSGKSIALNRGQTWIAAVPTSGGRVSW
ncbi:MAG TPA: DUF3048 domain-containing protein [Patescibacteria group bacterium]|jgi:hypothetical protein|nr:DUF3048 domain-containing protein [Patescibacteria group bacterium]